MDLSKDINLLAIMFWNNLLLFTCVLMVKTMQVPNPSWESLQAMLHEKLEDIYQNDKADVHKKIHAGKFFKYYLPGELGSYMVRTLYIFY